jgi:hypothetical protein
MKKFLAVLSVLALSVVTLYACDPNPAPQAPSQLPPSLRTPAPAPAPTYQAPAPAAIQESRTSQAELDFLATGPRLYPMDKAIQLSRQTGKPVVCWMGKHLFANEQARHLSKELGETTIQAAMDDDGETGKVDPRTGKRIPELRVKFSSSNYAPEAKTAYIPLEKFDRAGTAEKILAFARGGK